MITPTPSEIGQYGPKKYDRKYVRKKNDNNTERKIRGKEPVMPYIGQNWHDVKIDGICTQCTLYSSSVLIFCCFYLYNGHIKECTFDIFDKPILQV